MNKNIAGLKVTTTNKDGKSAQDLYQIWNKFMEKDFIESLQKIAKNPINYAVYTNYEKDFSEGNYDVYVGREIENSENNFENILVDWEKFEVFEFEYTSPESVFEAWKTIWENKNLNRAYTYDIEEYYEEGKFRIYISVN
jgi:transcription activator effector binding protein